MNTSPAAEPAQEPGSFQTLHDLRNEHTSLLRLHRQSGSSPDFVNAARRFIAQGRALGKLLDVPQERIEAQRILDQWGTVLTKAESSHEEIETTLFDYEHRTLPDEPSPYVGLNPFEEEDSALFFGRDGVRKQAIEILSRERLLAVFGVSGSGKSSLVRGGILPELHRGAIPGSEAWSYLPLVVPGVNPLHNLLTAWRENLPRSNATALDSAAVLKRPELLVESMRAALAGGSVVITVNQFEELFTLCESAEVGAAFVHALLAFADDSSAEHRVIVIMRSDFEPRLKSIPALRDRLADDRNILRLKPLTNDELREAIEKPARAVGLRFHPEVVDALLRDVQGEPAALPLLQFTLRMLWETRDGDRVTLEQYERLGGAKGALAKRADQFFLELNPEERLIARGILLRMVRIGEGLEATGVRIRRSSVNAMGFPPERIEAVISKLKRSGLVRIIDRGQPDDARLEIAHEAMIRNWRTLLEWLEEDRAKLTVRRRLDDKTAEWVRLGCRGAALLDKTQLGEAERWLNTDDARAVGFHPKLPALVAKSRERLESQRREKERNLYCAIGTLTTLLLIAASIACYAFMQKRDARKALARAVAARFVPPTYDDSSLQVGTNRLLLALHAALALKEAGLQVTPEITNALHRALIRPTFSIRSLRAFAFGRQGKQLVTVDGAGTISRWNTASGLLEAAFETGTPVPDLCSLSDDGTHLLGIWTGSPDSIIYDISGTGTNSGMSFTTNTLSFEGLSKRRPIVWMAALSRGGQRMAYVDQNGTHVQTLKPARSEARRLSDVGFVQLEFNTDGRRLAGLRRGSVTVFDTDTGAEIGSTTPATNAVTKTAVVMAWDPKGESLVIGDAEQTLSISKISALSVARPLSLSSRPKGSWLQIAFSRDGSRIAALSDDDVVRVCDVEAGREQAYVPLGAGLRRANFKPVFSPDLQSIAIVAREAAGDVLQIRPLKVIVDPVASARGNLNGARLTLENYAAALGDIVPAFQTAYNAARDDKVDEAIKQLRGVTFPPGVHFVASDEVFRVAAQGFIERANAFASTGRVEEAVREYKQATARDPASRRRVAQSALEEGIEWMQAGETNKAFDLFQQVRSFEPSFETNIQVELRRFRAESLLNQGLELVEDGQILQAIELFKEVGRIDPQFPIPASDWNDLCWRGSLAGFASNVIFACERAVALATNDIPGLTKGGILDSRGLARALTGDAKGAIADFKAYVEEGKGNPATLELRRNWIKQLEDGSTPEKVFTPVLLEQLRREFGF